MPTRNAQCLCGQLKIVTQGEPKFSVVCHCRNCQRQTGSAFRYALYFPEAAVQPEGQSQGYPYQSDAGRRLETQFCPKCGTTVYWRAEFAKGLVGTSGGCFEQRDFPLPKNSMWNESKQAWVSLPSTWTHHEKQ